MDTHATSYVLPGTHCAPASLRRTADCLKVEIEISEGMHHQVKRMVGAVGGALRGLKRVQLGPVALDDLAPGAAREVTDEELCAIARAVPFELRGAAARQNWTGDAGRPTERSMRRRRRERGHDVTL